MPTKLNLSSHPFLPYDLLRTTQPFFVLAFLKSLVEDGLLKYNTSKRTWQWEEDSISAKDVSGNVLYLLSSKMTEFPQNVQTALKVAACFGIMIKESVVSYLSQTLDYPNIRNDLKQVVAEDCMVKIGTTGFKFVHDKVREAAYSLIPSDSKNKVSIIEVNGEIV